MSSTNIKKNIERLLRERNWRITDLENKAHTGRVVHNIIHGTTSNPRVTILQALANAFNVEIEELLSGNDSDNNVNLVLLLDACKEVITEITPICSKYNIKPNNVLKLIRDVYKYSVDLNLPEIDKCHVKWLIQKHYSK